MSSYNNWYSTPKTVYDPDSTNDYNYCSFCLINFNKYNEVINNICQVCGRVNTRVMQDKQPTQQLTAVNAAITETEQSTMKGVSMEIRYSSLLTQDETKKGLLSGNTRVSFNSFKEAQKYLSQVSDVNNATLNARLKNNRQQQKYRISTTKPKRSIYSTTSSLVLDDDTNGLTAIERTNNDDNDDQNNYIDDEYTIY